MSVGARDVAVDALRDRNGNVSARLKTLLAKSSFSPADRALARELAMGVVRRRGCLRQIMRAFLTQPDKKLPTPVEEIILTALYQIFFLDRIPSFAAVDEAVRQTSDFHHKRQGGLVNGMLRTILRNIDEIHVEKHIESSEPAADVLPLAGGKGICINRAVFPDPQAKPVEYLASAWSLNDELARRWVQRYGFDLACELAGQACVSPPIIMRVNTLKAGVSEVVDALRQQGIPAEPHENSVSIVSSAESLRRPAMQEGFVQPQDPTATGVVAAMKIQPGLRVLDLCAAPGTKTTHIAERMHNEGSIVAMDVSQQKLDRIEQNCRRMGITCVTTMLTEQTGSLEPNSFDLVLADVPCSNTGVLARRPEAKWRFSTRGQIGLVKDQQFLLRMAAGFVGSGGRLVYSTCSIEPEENQQITQWAGKNIGNLKYTDEKLTLPAGAQTPTAWHDGGYYAIFKKR